jgi:hypothetical protein
MACLKLLLNEKLGLSALYPNNIIHLMNTAAEYSRSRNGIFTGQIGKVLSQKIGVQC